MGICDLIMERKAGGNQAVALHVFGGLLVGWGACLPKTETVQYSLGLISQPISRQYAVEHLFFFFVPR